MPAYGGSYLVGFAVLGEARSIGLLNALPARRRFATVDSKVGPVEALTMGRSMSARAAFPTFDALSFSSGVSWVPTRPVAKDRETRRRTLTKRLAAHRKQRVS